MITSLGKKRHEQLRSISDELNQFLLHVKEEFDYLKYLEVPIKNYEYDTQIHKLRGYCEHLKVIASHMEEDGWMPATSKCLDCGERFEGEHTCNKETLNGTLAR